MTAGNLWEKAHAEETPILSKMVEAPSSVRFNLWTLDKLIIRTYIDRSMSYIDLHLAT